jgi:hypothetical protein
VPLDGKHDFQNRLHAELKTSSCSRIAGLIGLPEYLIDKRFWTKSEDSPTLDGISRPFRRPQEVFNDHARPSNCSARHRSSHVALPKQIKARLLCICRHRPGACTGAERFAVRHRIHQSPNALHRNGRHGRQPDRHRGRRVRIHSRVSGKPAEGSTVVPRNQYVEIRQEKPKNKYQQDSPEFKTCKYTTEAFVADGTEKGELRKVCANPDCPVHHLEKQQRRANDDAEMKAAQEKQRREEATAQATGLRILKAIGDALPVRLMKRDLLVVVSRLSEMLDERKVDVLIRQHGMGKPKDCAAPEKLLAAFLPKAEEASWAAFWWRQSCSCPCTTRPMRTVFSAELRSCSNRLILGNAGATPLGCELPINLLNREGPGIEIAADPVTHFLMLFMIGIGEGVEEFIKPRDATTVRQVDRWTGETSIDTDWGGHIRQERQQLLEDDGVLPVITEIVGVDELGAGPSEHATEPNIAFVFYQHPHTDVFRVRSTTAASGGTT